MDRKRCVCQLLPRPLGPPLVLHRGTSGSGTDWRDIGYVEALKHDCKLILIDARGAGASDKPHDAAAYDPALRAKDVVAILDDLGNRHAHYFGYSLGGWVGLLLAKYAPDRCTSLILGGAHPYEENMQPVRDRMPKEMDAFMTATEQVYGSHLTRAMRARLRQNVLLALGAMSQDRSSIADVLPDM
jgi:pimeloyl-ACP methyl ester carboxylesterase